MEKYAPKTKSELRKLLANPEINLGDIDTSAITDMSNLFGSDFEDDLEFFRLDFSGIENWDTSHVENMSQMFEGIPYFNEPIGKWDVSHLKNMGSMFAGARSFNQPLNDWDVSNVVDMSSMFNGANCFNQPLDKWNVGKAAHH